MRNTKSILPVVDGEHIPSSGSAKSYTMNIWEVGKMKIAEYEKHMADLQRITEEYKRGHISLIEALQGIKRVREAYATWDREIEKEFARSLINAK